MDDVVAFEFQVGPCRHSAGIKRDDLVSFSCLEARFSRMGARFVLGLGLDLRVVTCGNGLKLPAIRDFIAGVDDKERSLR